MRSEIVRWRRCRTRRDRKEMKMPDANSVSPETTLSPTQRGSAPVPSANCFRRHRGALLQGIGRSIALEGPALTVKAICCSSISTADGCFACHRTASSTLADARCNRRASLSTRTIRIWWRHWAVSPLARHRAAGRRRRAADNRAGLGRACAERHCLRQHRRILFHRLGTSTSPTGGVLRSDFAAHHRGLVEHVSGKWLALGPDSKVYVGHRILRRALAPRRP